MYDGYEIKLCIFTYSSSIVLPENLSGFGDIVEKISPLPRPVHKAAGDPPEFPIGWSKHIGDVLVNICLHQKNPGTVGIICINLFNICIQY